MDADERGESGGHHAAGLFTRMREAMGTVYGDIGTSVLYTLMEITRETVSAAMADPDEFPCLAPILDRELEQLGVAVTKHLEERFLLLQVHLCEFRVLPRDVV